MLPQMLPSRRIHQVHTAGFRHNLLKKLVVRTVCVERLSVGEFPVLRENTGNRPENQLFLPFWSAATY